MRVKLSVILVCLLLTAFTFPAWGTVYTDTVNHWSEQSVSKMDAEGLIRGDGQGRFYPEKSVTRQEVITLLIRLVDKETDAKAVAPNTASVKKTAKALSDWAVGYLEVAKRQGIVTDSEVQSLSWNGAAERQEVAVWLCKALKLAFVYPDTEKVLASFKDSNKINNLKVPYIIPLVRDKIFVGSGGYFKPADPVKRAEVAVLLDRADTKYLSETIIRSRQGQIINIGSSSLTVRNASAQASTLTVTAQTVLYKNGKKITTAGLSQGNWLEYISDSASRLSYGEVIDPGAVSVDMSGIVHGKINSVIYAATSQIILSDNNNHLSTYNVEPNTSFSVDGVTSAITGLRPGQDVNLKFADGKLSSVTAITSGAGLKGKISNINPVSGTLELLNNSTALFFVMSQDLLTQLKNNAEQVNQGDNVEITFSNGLVSTIKKVQQVNIVVSGKIYSTGSTFISITNSRNNQETYTLDGNTKITRNGRNVDRTDLQKNDRVELTINGTLVIDIKADAGSVEPVIYKATLDTVDTQDKQIDLASGTVKYLEDRRWRSESGSLSLDLAGDVGVYYDGDELDLDELENYEGDHVYVVYDQEQDEAVKVLVQKGTEYTYDDEISSSRSSRFELNGESQTFYHDDGTIVIKDGEIIDGSDLEENDRIFVVANKDGSTYNAAVVELIPDSDEGNSKDNYTVYKGELDTVDTGKEKIYLTSGTVEELANSRWRSRSGSSIFYLENNVDIYYDGDEVDLDELENYEGDHVYVVYDQEQDEAVKVLVQKGTEYTYDDEISSSRSSRFELNGESQTFYHNDGTIVIKDGEIIDGSALEENDRVFVVANKDGSTYNAAVLVAE